MECLSICPPMLTFFLNKCQFSQGMYSNANKSLITFVGLALFHRQHPQKCCVLFCEQWHWHKEEQFCLAPTTNLPSEGKRVSSFTCSKALFLLFPPCKYSLSLLWSGSRPICSPIFLHRVQIKFYKSVLLKQQNVWGTILDSGRGISTEVLKILKY